MRRETCEELVRRLADTCERCVGNDYELILVNDCSTDDTWPGILRLSAAKPQVIGVDLAHNHGHQLAVTAGLFVATGDRVMIIDADLQDPPELLPEMMAQLDAGADVAYGQRLQRKGESWFKKASAAFFYRLLRRLGGCADTCRHRRFSPDEARKSSTCFCPCPSSTGSFAEW